MGVAQRKRNRKKVRLRSQKRSRPKKVSPKDVQIDPMVKKIWDPKKTLTENCKKLGIDIDYNKVHHLSSVIEDAKEEFPGMELSISEKKVAKSNSSNSKLEELVNISEEITQKEPTLCETELHYFKALIKKHKDNYKAMTRDIKLNYLQLTAKNLEKSCQLYNQRYAQLPKWKIA